MSPEEKIEAAQKLIAEARAEIAAKRRNWLEEAKPGMLFRSNGKVVAIPPRHPVDHAISLDPERIGMSCYGWESAPDIEYLGHARDLIRIADDAHAPDLLAIAQEQRAVLQEAKAAMRDMLCGWKMIRDSGGEGKIYGIGWDRAQAKVEAALDKIP